MNETKTIKRKASGKAETINININLSGVPEFAKDKKFPVKKTGKVTSYFQSIAVDLSPESKPGKKSKSTPISKASSQIDGDGSTSFSSGITPPVDPDTLAEFRTYNAYHDRSIRLKALAVAYQGYDVLPVDSNDEDYEDNPEYKKVVEFTDKPNEMGEDFIDIIYGYAEDFYTFRSAYLEVVRNLKGELKEIYNMRAPYVRIKKKGSRVSFVQKDGAKEVEFQLFTGDPKQDKKQNEVLWLKDYYSKSKYYGIPDYYSAMGDLTLDRSSVEYNIRRFKNGLMIDFIIVVEGGEVDSKVLEDINKFLKTNYQGLANAGKALYLNSDTPDVKIRIEKVSAEVKEASFIKQREFSREVIMVGHGTNAKVLGLQTPGQLGGGESDSQFRIFEETITKPDRLRIQRKLNLLVKYGLGVENFYIQLRELNVDSFKDLVDTANSASSIIDENERRILIGYEPKEETEEKTVADELEDIEKALINIRKSVAG